MSGLNDQLIQAIRQIAGVHLKDNVYTFDCTVDSVKESDFECDVIAIGGNATTKIPSVRLAAEANDGFTLIPKVGSTVTVTITDRGLAYISMFSDIDKVKVVINKTLITITDGEIKFNDGSFGGLIKIEAITNKLNQLVAQVQAQLPLIAAGIAAGGGSYSPGTLSSFVKTDYENDKINHGT